MSCEGNWEHFESFYKGNLTFLHLVSILLLGLIFYSFLCPISYTSQWRWCLNALDAPAHFHLVQKSVINKNSDLSVCITPTAIYLKNVPLFLSVNTTNPFWRCFPSLSKYFQNSSQKQMEYKNVFKQFWEKGIKFMSSSTKNALQQNKNNFFFGFLCVCVCVCASLVVSTGLEDYVLKQREKWFSNFLSLVWI